VLLLQPPTLTLKFVSLAETCLFGRHVHVGCERVITRHPHLPGNNSEATNHDRVKLRGSAAIGVELRLQQRQNKYHVY